MLISMKAETEAEGISLSGLLFLKNRSIELGLPLYLKIGGVEAKSDMELASRLELGGVIAPMVESAFGVEKFVDAVSSKNFSWLALTIESRTALDNLDEILVAARGGGICGITLGRGDLAASLGKNGQEDSPEILDIAKNVSNAVRESGLNFTIGGNVRASSMSALLNSSLSFDAVETRRFRFSRQESIEENEQSLAEALNLEIDFVRAGAQRLASSYEASLQRLVLLDSRKSV